MASKKFEKNGVENLSTLLSGENRYEVPFSQRNYAWETTSADQKENHVGAFWDAMMLQYEFYRDDKKRKEELKRQAGSAEPEQRRELVKAANEIDPGKKAEYFIGPMVFVKKTESEERFEIVDGQQRMTTLTMLLCIIRDLTNEISEKNEEGEVLSSVDFREIRKLIEIIENGEHREWRLQPNNVDKHLFNTVILPYKSSQHRNDNQDQPSSFTEGDTTPGKPFLLLSEKIDYFNKEIEKDAKPGRGKKSPYETKQSNIRIMKAYVFLYNKIIDALISNFSVEDEEVRKLRIEIDTDDAKVVDNLLRIPGPIKDAFGNETGVIMKNEFFNDETKGIDYLEKKYWSSANKKFGAIEWSEESETKIKNDYATYEARPTSTKEFDDWLKNKIEKRRAMDLGKALEEPEQGESYVDFRKKLIEKQHLKSIKEKTENKITELYNFISYEVISALYSVRITVEDLEIASGIFETLNSKGEPLTKTNLVKNHVLSHLETDEEREEYGLKWDAIIGKINSEKADDFLRESLRSRGRVHNDRWIFDKYKIGNSEELVSVTKARLYKIIKNMIKTKQEAKNYVTTLDEDVLIRKKLDDPEENLTNEDEGNGQWEKFAPALYTLSKLDAVYIRIPIMTAWRHWGRKNGNGDWINTSNEFSMFVKFLVEFFLKYKTIRNQNATALDGYLIKVCELIMNNEASEKQKVLDKIIKYLGQYDDDIDFKNKLKEVVMNPSDSISNLLLQNISIHLGTDNSDVEPVTKLTIEHVLPQKPKSSGSEKWDETKFFTDYDETNLATIQDFFSDETISKQKKEYGNFINRLGNLTLLTQKINSTIRNSNFETKKIHFKNLTENKLKARGCNLDNQPTQCLKYNSAGTLTKCEKHDIKDGLNSSSLEINLQTVMKIENTDTDRTEWTAKSILERTKFFVETIEGICKLPKVFCEKASCPNHKNGTFWNVNAEKLKIEEIPDAKCDHKDSLGSKCGGELHVLWPTANASIFRAPGEYHARGEEVF